MESDLTGSKWTSAALLAGFLTSTLLMTGSVSAQQSDEELSSIGALVPIIS